MMYHSKNPLEIKVQPGEAETQICSLKQNECLLGH